MDFALGMLVFVAALAGGQEPRDGGHVRTMDVRIRAEIDEGMARSAFFRDLVTRLDASDVIVYVGTECPMSPRLFGRLQFMARGGGRRYLNVRVQEIDIEAPAVPLFSATSVAKDAAAMPKNFPNLNAKSSAQLKLLWIACGTADGLVGVNRQFRDWLQTQNVALTYTEIPDIGHVWPLWRQNLTDLAPLLFQMKAK